MKVQFQDGARLGRTPPCRATRRQGNADLWSAQPAEGGRREGPPVRGAPLSAGTPAFSVIRTAGWYSPFAALRAAVPAPTGRTGQRSAFLAAGTIWTGGVCAWGCIFAAKVVRQSRWHGGASSPQASRSRACRPEVGVPSRPRPSARWALRSSARNPLCWGSHAGLHFHSDWPAVPWFLASGIETIA